MAPLFHKTGVHRVILFGSCARGSDTKRSDLDLMIIMDTEQRFFDRFDQFDSIHAVLNDRPVDLLIYTPKELDAISDRPFIKQALKEGVVIYER